MKHHSQVLHFSSLWVYLQILGKGKSFPLSNTPSYFAAALLATNFFETLEPG
jgi:hypothetical protein